MGGEEDKERVRGWSSCGRTPLDTSHIRNNTSHVRLEPKTVVLHFRIEEQFSLHCIKRVCIQLCKKKKKLYAR